MEPQKIKIENNFRAEVVRKLFHLISVIFPLIYFYSSKKFMLLILIPVTVLFLVVDIIRNFHKPSADTFFRLFGYVLRPHERSVQKKNLNGATWGLLTATFCVIFFPKYITIISFAILTFSDTASSLVGRRYGRTKFRGRSLEGGAAFVIVAIMVILATPKIEYEFGEYLICIVAAIVGAIAEILAGDKVNDNIAIPLSIGTVLWLLYYLVYPAMNIYKF
jgi:diacylglycerol kinase (CTP)